jgi:glycosyltransferase involved in cell wall biosynthesis
LEKIEIGIRMKFSIVTVCYNSAETIRYTFDSILTQRCQNYEYIVIDGLSTDGTLDIIKEYIPKFKGKLRWISEADKGIFDAMNKGIIMAKGDIIGIINADDFYVPEALETIATIADKHPEVDVFYGIMKWIDKNRKEIFVERRHHSTLPLNPIPHPTTFIRKHLYEENKCYDTSLKLTADYDLLLRMFLKKYCFSAVDKILTVVLKTGASNQNHFVASREVLSIQYKYGILSKKKYYCKSAIFLIRRLLHALKF